MTIITNYKNTRIEAQSWAAATCVIAQLQAEEAKAASLLEYQQELPDIDFNDTELQEYAL